MDSTQLNQEWKESPRWHGILRNYSAEDVVRLKGSIEIDYSISRQTSQKLWNLFQNHSLIQALGAMTGHQAVQMVQAGLLAVYASGWQVAADANSAGQTYPDQSLYPPLSMPGLIRRITQALIRADQIQSLNNSGNIDWLVPIVADAEAGFGGPLNIFEQTKAMIEAGVAAIHLEDQVSSLKKCGHVKGKVLIPQKVFIKHLMAARLAADVMNVPLLLIARTDSRSAAFIRSDFDEADRPFLTQEKSFEGFYPIKNSLDYAILRGINFAPFADLVWFETDSPDLYEAKEFASAIHQKYPGKWLAYNCSASFRWKEKLGEKALLCFQNNLSEMGYKFQFIPLAGFHTLNASMFSLAKEYKDHGMFAYSQFQENEFSLENFGYTATKNQEFVGTDYFGRLYETISGNHSL